jgi:two-component system, NtrC family, response regulator GlrR
LPATILLVDDKPDHLLLVSNVLTRRGFRVLTALSGEDGIRLFSMTGADLVVLDYYMPGLDGGATAREMRRLRPEVPIIIFSGALTLPDRVMAMIDGFISTSEEPEVLLHAIDKLIQPKVEVKAS